MSDGSQHVLFYKDYTGNTDYHEQRHTGCTLSLNKGIIKSSEIFRNRQTPPFRYGTSEIVGDILTELSFTGIDRLLSSAFLSYWEDSRILVIRSERNPIEVVRVLATMPGSGDKTVIFAFERIEVSSLSLSATPGETIKITFSCLGKTLIATEDTNAIPNPPTSVDTSQSMVGFEGNVLMDGYKLTIVTEIQLNIDNSLQSRYVIYNKYSLSPSASTAIITGQMTVYFENIDIYNKFYSEHSFVLQLDFKDQQNNRITITLADVKATTAQIDVNNDGPILLPMAFEAAFHSAEQTAIKLEKFTA